MDLERYIFENFDELIKTTNKLPIDNKIQYNRRDNKNTIVIDEDYISDDSNDSNGNNDNNDNNDDFYTREDIYGEYDSDDDEIEYEHYNTLPTIIEESTDIINCNICEEEQNDDDDVFNDLKEKYEDKIIAKQLFENESDDDFKKIFDKITQSNEIKLNTNNDEQEALLQQKLNNPYKKVVRISNHEPDFIDNVLSSQQDNFHDNENNNENNDESEDKGYYIINVMNLFMQYYNDKYNKNDNFMTGINNNNEANEQMTLFMSYINEYEYIKVKIFDNKKESFYFENKDFVSHYLDDDEIESFYILILKDDNDIENKRIYSPSLIDCLNYVYETNFNNKWNIVKIK